MSSALIVAPPEVIAAVAWACARLRDPGLILKGADPLPIDAIAEGAPGAPVADAARWILSRMSHGSAAISAAQAAQAAKAASLGALKGDGLLRPDAAPDMQTRALIAEIAQCQGTVTEASVEAAATVQAMLQVQEAAKAVRDFSDAGASIAPTD